MNEHIKHLEEPLYNGDLNATNLNFIDVIYSPKVSIKIDGSPSIFFGCVENNFFIATKSIFNKNRKMFFSIDEIYKSVSDLELAEKLRVCFTTLKNDFTSNNIIYQADLISWNTNENSVYQPNVLQYHIPINQPLNLSIHTTYNDLNFIEVTYMDDVYHPCNHNNSLLVDEKYFRRLMGIYSKWQTYAYYFKQNLGNDILEDIKWLNHKDMPLERYFNNCIRTNLTPSRDTYSNWFEEKGENLLSLKQTSPRDWKTTNNSSFEYQLDRMRQVYKSCWFSDYLELYNFTVNIKNDMVNVLNEFVLINSNTITNHVANFKILNVNGNHEGFVFTNPCKKIKMINRSEFSFHNFSKHGGIKNDCKK